MEGNIQKQINCVYKSHTSQIIIIKKKMRFPT